MAWIYLLIASVLHTAWIFSVKFLSFKKIAAIQWNDFFENSEQWIGILPLLGYIFIGLANAYFFALALKQITTSVAFAIWVSLSLLCVKGIEVVFYKQILSAKELLFFALIIIGILGLKKGG